MLKTKLLHPQITAALAQAGHGSKVLISDGNYPHSTAKGPEAEVVYLNLTSGCVSVTDVLKVLADAIPIEKAEVMSPEKSGPYAKKNKPPVWDEFVRILQSTDCKGKLNGIERFKFYQIAGRKDVCLTIATGETRGYANLLLTIGVVQHRDY